MTGFTPAPPAGVAFPYGGLSLSLEVYATGWPVDIQVGTAAPTTTLVKFFDGEWGTPPTAVAEAIDGGTLWTFRVIDNGYGDNDDEGAFIADPVAVGMAASFTG